MHRYVLLFIVGSVVCLFTVSIDRWGQKAFVSLVLSSVAPAENAKPAKIRTKSIYDLPENFLVGTSSSAYQIEGAWDEDGKTPSIWDDFVHFHPKAVDDNTTGDVTSDSYHNYAEDIRALKLVGVNILYTFDDNDWWRDLFTKFQHYRFSIAWTRILPNGSAVNQRGIDYYANLIDELLANDIEPVCRTILN